MRYFLFLFFLFLFNLFAGSNSCNKLYKLNTSVNPNPLVENLIPCSGTTSCTVNDEWQCSNNKFVDWSIPTQGVSYGAGYKWNATRSTYYLTTVLVCPDGTEPNSNNICEIPPPPATCSWATTPPWVSSYRSELECSNVSKGNGPSTDRLSYLWNWRWCDVEQKCYGLEYGCPVGTIWDSTNQICRSPKEPYQPDCGSCGTYKVSGSIENPQVGKECFIDYICKCNPKIRTRINVSCAPGPLEPDPIDPLHPLEEPEQNPTSPSSSNKDHSTKCGTDKMMAKAYCDAFPKNVLKFECDPLTGISSYTCNPKTEPEKTPINEGDSTKGSTTEDIKNLQNVLPDSIKDALKDYFTDGSMPHLEAIRGSLQASTILQADANDKLDSISSSVDASLILQTDASTKLDGIKSSTDALKGSVDSQKSVLDQIADFFNDTSDYNGSDMPTDSDLSPDSNTTEGLDTFTNSLSQVQDQFDQAKTIFSGGVPGIAFGNGSCPSYSFMGHSVSLSSIGQSISPYSSILSILIYISLMINAFRMIFGFFSKGV